MVSSDWQVISEGIARDLVSHALDVTVEPHDGHAKGDGLYDFKIVRPNRIDALEVTMAADADALELMKLMDNRWIRPELTGGWHVEIARHARWKKLQKQLPKLLRRLESDGISRVEVPRFEYRTLSSDVELIKEMRVRRIWQGGTEVPGSVYFHLDGSTYGGFVDMSGAALVGWMDRWIADPERADNPRKLAQSMAEERHLFVVIPPATTLPNEALLLLQDEERTVPGTAPSISEQITDVWIVDSLNFSKTGVRWSHIDGWMTFDKV